MTPEIIEPTDIVRDGLGLAPIGAPSELEALCAVSGRRISESDPVVRAKDVLGQNFTNQSDLACHRSLQAFPSRLVHGTVAAVMTKRVMEAVGSAVITRDGAWSLRRDNERAWLLHDPPEPPFIAQVRTSQLQHLSWRADVTLDRDFIRLCLGGRTLDIRRPLVFEAVELFARYFTGTNQSHPFVKLDRNCAEPMHGTLRSDTPPELARWCSRLGPGELWALAFLAKRKPATPEAGEPIAVKPPKNPAKA